MTFRKLFICSVCFFAVFSCSNKSVDPEYPTETTPGQFRDSSQIAFYWKDFFTDDTIREISDVKSMNVFMDGTYISELTPITASSDCRLELFADSIVRFISRAEGYGFNMPDSLDPKPDYTMGGSCLKVNFNGGRIRATYEKVRGYSGTEDGYAKYTTSWLNRYFANKRFLSENNLKYYVPTITGNTSICPGYVVDIWSILIKDADNFEFPYYKLAIVRKSDQWANFVFLLMKTAEDQSDVFNDILSSVRTFNKVGNTKTYLAQQKPTPNPRWSAATKALYEKLQQQNYTLWGAFNSSMVCEDTGDEYTINLKNITEEKARMEGPDGWNCKFGIMPTYAPIYWYGKKYYFPVDMANTFAGGDGENGKPILQYTYQYTTNNNNVSTTNKASNPSPVISVLRGRYDDYFREIAQGIKEYGKPMFFRLNNEMNSDWTSYCGLMTLCDPELYIDSWKHLYNIFEEEGVDNCIWIFNPNNITSPYCYWGEDICYYPGQDYVQILGLTAYESNNGTANSSFKTLYTNLWNKNKKYFEAMPAVISEFACGSGGNTTGELMRNAASQAQWITEMFEEFAQRPEYVKNIKGAIWFSVNDGEDAEISNYFYLDPRLTESLAAFRAGLAATVPSGN